MNQLLVYYLMDLVHTSNSIDNRVIDMLNVKLTDEMSERVNIAINNAIKDNL